jgi:hypothetical protein
MAVAQSVQIACGLKAMEFLLFCFVLLVKKDGCRLQRATELNQKFIVNECPDIISC